MAIMRTMKVEHAEITLSSDTIVSAIAFLFGLLLLVGLAMVLTID